MNKRRDVAAHPSAAIPGPVARRYILRMRHKRIDVARLYATATVFHAEQASLANPAGAFTNGDTYYSGQDTFVTGYELEIAGRVTDHWTLSGGWTQLTIEDARRQAARPYLPRQTLKLATSYTIPQARDLKLGADLRWQGETSVPDIVLIRQPAYAVVDLMASVRLVDKVRLAVNIKNLGNQRYIGSLEWNQAYYAAPRSASVTLSWSY